MIIYKITNLITNKVYIGQTVQTLEKRWKRHCWNSTILNPRMAISCAIIKYGKNNFKIEQIDKAKSIDELNEKEQRYIELYNSIVPNGYNLKSGGKSNGFLSKETKIKISRANKGKLVSNETRKRSSIAHLGFKHSEETKRKLSAINKGKKPHINTIKASRKKFEKTYNFIDPNGNVITITNLKEFCKNNNLHYPKMNQVANNKLKTYKKWQIQPLEELSK